MDMYPKVLKSWCILIFCCKLIRTDKYTFEINKLSDCSRCKVLTNSFKHWVDKTSRGKYEGGDAAWEEAKLKSYSRSEIRLVEIQENLCSELKTHKDACYALADEAEQFLETWWFHNDPRSSDLFTWLCIKTLQHCCPEKHFGDTCNICPLDKNSRVCSGHGKCDGDGTRNGNGTCICKRGYTGILCDKCDENFYSSETGNCEPCHKSCSGCSGAGANSCKSCSPGWLLESNKCVDINECSLSICKLNEYCINTEGSYSCKECDLSCKSCSGEGPNKCTSCESTNILWFGSCIDHELKINIVIGLIKKLALYIGLLTITLFLFRTSKSIASLVILIIAIFIYFSEKHQRTATIDVVLNLFFNSN